ETCAMDWRTGQCKGASQYSRSSFNIIGRWVRYRVLVISERSAVKSSMKWHLLATSGGALGSTFRNSYTDGQITWIGSRMASRVRSWRDDAACGIVVE